MVERYLINYDERGETVHPSGDFVHYEDFARLQEQVETLRKELASEKISASAWADSARINLHRAEAAEAERDRLRAMLDIANEQLADMEFLSIEGFISWKEDRRAVLQKGPQP